ncbi:MAG TPA: peptidylprolyl isomerase [Kiritimatiellia bacterium]|nr:peptidylprolyl isomerase [Kiritimatiellia bacterium]HMO99396.1 peptidylprolyl isomerase [Kiritimatiellia bacterium]HMP97607.1 peptidylprolyl isomerase [Kiritimatiellia bacterium]
MALVYRTSYMRLLVAGMATAAVMTTGCSKASESGSDAASAPAEIFSQPLSAAAGSNPDAVIAVVDGKEITQAEFDREMVVMMNRMQGRVPPDRIGQMREQMRTQLLDNLITREILLAKVKAEGIEITDADFAEAVEQLTENFPPGVSLEDMLEQTGTSMDDFRENFGMELKVRKLIESHTGGKLVASDEDIRAFYDENSEQFERPESVQASHILISVDPTDSEEAKAAKRQQIEALREQALEGADFAALAGEHSTCPSSAQGGDLGSFTRGRMVPEFEAAAFSQEIGAVGDVVETQFGFHLIKVTERNEPGMTPFEEIKEQLGQYLTNQKQQQAAQTYLQELREAATVTYPDNP